MSTTITATAKLPPGLALALERIIKAVDKDAVVVLDPPIPSIIVTPVVDGETDPV
jgi:hypothetical protein